MDNSSEDFPVDDREAADPEKKIEYGPVGPSDGGEWLGNVPTDPDDPRFPEGLNTVAEFKEKYRDSTILVTGKSRDPATGGYVVKRGVLGIWKFDKE